MSVALTVQHELQSHDVGLSADDTGRATTVKRQRDLSIAIQRTARVAPQHREGAEALAAIGHIYPRRSAQLVPVVQAHGGAAHNVLIHFFAPLFSRQDCNVPSNPCAEFPCEPMVSAHRSALAELSSVRTEK